MERDLTLESRFKAAMEGGKGEEEERMRDWDCWTEKGTEGLL